MIMIRTLLTLAAGIGVGVAITFAADHDHHMAVKVTQLSQRHIIEKLDGKESSATVLEVTFEPGQKDTPHRHAGPVFGYVLECEYERAINDEPVKTYKTGDTSTSRPAASTRWRGTRARRRRRASSAPLGPASYNHQMKPAA
jgi:hypothetical protein